MYVLKKLVKFLIDSCSAPSRAHVLNLGAMGCWWLYDGQHQSFSKTLVLVLWEWPRSLIISTVATILALCLNRCMYCYQGSVSSFTFPWHLGDLKGPHYTVSLRVFYSLCSLENKTKINSAKSHHDLESRSRKIIINVHHDAPDFEMKG